MCFVLLGDEHLKACHDLNRRCQPDEHRELLEGKYKKPELGKVDATNENEVVDVVEEQQTTDTLKAGGALDELDQAPRTGSDDDCVEEGRIEEEPCSVNLIPHAVLVGTDGGFGVCAVSTVDVVVLIKCRGTGSVCGVSAREITSTEECPLVLTRLSTAQHDTHLWLCDTGPGIQSKVRNKARRHETSDFAVALEDDVASPAHAEADEEDAEGQGDCEDPAADQAARGCEPGAHVDEWAHESSKDREVLCKG